MTQNLINPFNLKEQSPYPGLIYRNDKVVEGIVSFKLQYDVFYNYLLSILDSSLPNFDYHTIRSIKAHYAIHPRLPDDVATQELAHKITSDILYIINILTFKDKPFRLLEFINFNVTKLPEFILRITQTINSHNYVENIEGTPTSVFKWNQIVLEFIFYKNEKPSNFDDPGKLKVIINRINSVFNLWGEMKVEEFDDMSILFNKSGDELKISCDFKEDEIIMNCGDGVSEEDFIQAIITGINYNIFEKNIVQTFPLKISEHKCKQILKINSNLFNNVNLNLASSTRLTNEYLNSDIASKANEKISFKGFKDRKGKHLTKNKSRQNRLKIVKEIDKKNSNSDTNDPKADSSSVENEK